MGENMPGTRVPRRVGAPALARDAWITGRWWLPEALYAAPRKMMKADPTLRPIVAQVSGLLPPVPWGKGKLVSAVVRARRAK